MSSAAGCATLLALSGLRLSKPALNGASVVVGSSSVVARRSKSLGGGLPAAPPRRLSLKTASPDSKKEQEDKRKALDRLGSWDTRLDMPIVEESSIRRGLPVPNLRASAVGVAESEGRRTYMEDRHTVLDVEDGLLLLAVWDGHGGAGCSEFCRRQVGAHLDRRLQEETDRGRKADLTAVLTKVVLDLNESYEKHWASVRLVGEEPEGEGETKATDDTKKSPSPSSAPLRSPGTTATLALIRDGYELVVAHVGDSCALLCRDGRARRMTEDHCASHPDERRRIEAAGGRVDADNIGRHLVNGRLAMSRSLGDLDLKPFGVTCAPDVRRRSLKHGKDRFLVLFTDGVSHVLTDEEVLETVAKGESPQEAADKLVDQALLYSAEDNVTALVLPLGSWGKGDDRGTSMLFSLGRHMTNTSRYG